MSENTEEIRDRVIDLLETAYSKRVNDLATSVQLAQEALALSRSVEDQPLIAQSLSRLSLFQMILGNYDECMDLASEALTCFRELKDDKGVADVKYNIAGTYYKTDNFHLGLVHLIDCLEIYQRLDDWSSQARVHKTLGTIYEYFGDEKSAVLSYESAIEVAEKIGDVNMISNTYNPLSGIYLNRGAISKAKELIEESIRIKSATGDLRGLAFALYGKSKICSKEGLYGEAEDLLNRAEAMHLEMGERLGLCMSLRKKGVLFFQMGKLDQAIQAIHKALEVAGKYNVVLVKFKCYYQLYEIHKAKGDCDAALKYLEIYLTEKEGVINSQTQKVIESYEAITKMERLQKESQMERERAEIMQKKDRAEHAMKVRQEFLSTMSHEIRTPLNAVITITSLLEEKEDTDENKLLESLRFSANNLLRIINDILDFSKLEVGKVKLDFRNINFEKLLEGIVNTYKSSALEKGIELVLTKDPTVKKRYVADDTKLFQILGNLIDNAIKFTDEGSVELQVIMKRELADKDELLFKVVDTGIGVSENFIDEIFDSFSQASSYITRKKGGSGLGLAIVKKMVELHGSQVEALSVEDCGSIFYFPLMLKHGKEVQISATQSLANLEGKRVLLAEDNMINAMVCIKLLSNWGMKAFHSKDGAEAIEMANTEVYDFILMDIHMPEIDGYSAAGEIKKSKGINALTPIFALTADITAKQEEELGGMFDEILLKPIEREKLEFAFLSRSVKR